MAATTLVRELLWRVSSQLLDTSPQFKRWGETELVFWLNDAQRAIAKFLPWSCARVDAVKLVAGTRQSIETILAANVIPGDGSSPANVNGRVLQDVIRNMGADGATPGTSIRLLRREDLDTNRTDWHTAAGAPISGYVFDPRTPKVFYVYPPVPSATAQWVELSYLAHPKDITAAAPGNSLYSESGGNATTISVDDIYVDDIANYITARAHMKDAEAAGNNLMAAYYTQQFVSSINAQAAALTGVNPNLQSLPFAPQLPATAH